MSDTEKVTACALVIGNEVLSGRTRDENLHWIANRCTEIGIRLAEARILPDVSYCRYSDMRRGIYIVSWWIAHRTK